MAGLWDPEGTRKCGEEEARAETRGGKKFLFRDIEGHDPAAYLLL